MTSVHPAAVPRYTLDISRLLSRSRARVPTGIDRVELEYALYLCANAPERTEFAAVHPLGLFAPLPFAMASDFVSTIAALWDSGENDAGTASRLGMRLLHGIVLPKMERGPPSSRHHRHRRSRSVYLLLSHHHLTRPNMVMAAIRRNNSLFVPMVHDLIPLEYPEYSREKEPQKHRRRVDTVVNHADAVITPSEAVRDALLPYLSRAGRSDVPVWPIPHGVHLRALADGDGTPARDDKGQPYFICLGTVEARKNHLLLLNIWRRMIETHGAAAPRLVIVGKRGWENEQVLDMIERSPALHGFVVEHNALPDTEVVRLLRGARALLFPSFTEGFGLPLAEALALGTPVVCSDIPVFHEVGGGAAHYLDPLDGIAWLRTIEGLADLAVREEVPLAALDQDHILDWDRSVGRALSKVEDFVRHASRQPNRA